MVTLVLQVHQALLDHLELLFLLTDPEDMRIMPGITQPLKERKVIVDHQELLKFQVLGRLMTFTL